MDGSDGIASTLDCCARQRREICDRLARRAKFHFPRRANQWLNSRCLDPARGADRASSRTRDGMRWTRQRWRARWSQGEVKLVSGSRRARRTAQAAYGKTVWSWHPLLVSSCRWRDRFRPDRSAIKPAVTVTRRIRRRGEHGISRKAIAQGMPECSGCTCMLVCALPCAHCTRDRGCSKHPAFPAPSFPRVILFKTRARRAAGQAYLCLFGCSGTEP